jgi:hypothetical protein
MPSQRKTEAAAVQVSGFSRLERATHLNGGIQENGYGRSGVMLGGRSRFFLAACLFITLLAMVVPLHGQKPTPAAGEKSTPPDGKRTVTEEQANDANIQLMRQNIRAERKKIVAANMPLTEAEATKFWPLYDRYIGETIKVNDVRYALIKEYAQTYGSMTDAQADSFIRRWVALDEDNTRLRLKYIPEFQNVISHKKTALFFQIDRRISMLIELQLASQVPLLAP